MSVLVVGLSHRTAPIELLERVALGDARAVKLLHDAVGQAHVSEAAVLSTCNRLEVYADVTRFHGGVADVTELLARHTEVAPDDLAPYLYTRYEERAVEHLFSLACGLDSMVVGEAQVLGQLRAALRTAQAERTVGGALDGLVQQALRVGKRAHAETGIDRAAPSLVTAGLALAVDGDLAGRRALVVGAGSVGRLAAAVLTAAGADVVVVNRTAEHARHLAASFGARAAGLDALAVELAVTDVVVSCTGAAGVVLDASTVASARTGVETPLAVLDLALPHDVDPEVGTLPGVRLVGLAQLAARADAVDLGAVDPSAVDLGAVDAGAAADVEDVRRIAADGVATYLSELRGERVAPTVVALRERAQEVVDLELARLDARLPGLDPAARDETADALRRAVEKLLHEPTVRMKALAAEHGGDRYAEALHTLFDLPDPTVVDDGPAEAGQA